MMTENDIRYFLHLLEFNRTRADLPSLTSLHVSLYFALCFEWYNLALADTFPVNRRRVRQRAGIGSNNSYQQSLKDLATFGLISYQPGMVGNVPAMIGIIPLNGLKSDSLKSDSLKSDSLKIDTVSIESEPVIVADLIPVVLHTYNINKESSSSTNNITTSQNNDQDEQKSQIQNVQAVPPQFQEVLSYFQKMGLPASEAVKFCRYNDQRSWKVAGVTMKSWVSAAEIWISKMRITHEPKTATNGKYGPL